MIGIGARRLRWAAAGLALTAALATGVGVSLSHDSTTTHSTTHSNATVSAGRHGPPSAPTTIVATRNRILFLGASYTWGLGAQPRQDGYAWDVGRTLNRPVEVQAVPGIGFLNPGPHHAGTFAERLTHLPPAPDPALVVIQGGRNDIGYPAPELGRAVAATIAEARHRFGRTPIALLGPVPASLPVSAGARVVEQTMREQAQAAHVLFVDPIAEQWITTQNVRSYAGPVPGHPNDAGYAMIAGRLCPHLRTLLPTGARPGTA